MKELWDIFIAFAGVGGLTFGGGYAMMPLLQKDIAEKRGWVTGEEISDTYAVAQCLPGIIAANTAMLLGYKLKKIPGLLAAGLGVIFPSVAVILIIAAFIRSFMEYPWVAHAFNGVRVAVLTLILDAAIKMWKSGVKDWAGIVIFGATLGLLTFAPSVSPIWPLAAGAVCGIVLKERKRGEKTR